MRSSRAPAAPAERLRTSRGTQFRSRSFYDDEGTRAAAIAALGVGVALAASACAGGGSSGSSASGGGSASGGSNSSSSGPVSLTLWNNATPGPGLTYYENAIKQFEADHPGVTIKMQNIQNEDYDGKLQTALASNTAPDIFFQRGGGEDAGHG